MSKSRCIREEVVVFGKKWLQSEKICCIPARWLYSDKVVVFGPKWFYWAKVVVIGQKWLSSGKSGFSRESGSIRAKLLYPG